MPLMLKNSFSILVEVSEQSTKVLSEIPGASPHCLAIVACCFTRKRLSELLC